MPIVLSLLTVVRKEFQAFMAGLFREEALYLHGRLFSVQIEAWMEKADFRKGHGK